MVAGLQGLAGLGHGREAVVVRVASAPGPLLLLLRRGRARGLRRAFRVALLLALPVLALAAAFGVVFGLAFPGLALLLLLAFPFPFPFRRLLLRLGPRRGRGAACDLRPPRKTIVA